MLDDTATQTYAAIGTILLLSTATYFFYPANLLRWAEKKKYQYEVTFALYMLTPTEKFIFNSVLFLFLSMVLIAASLYLPEHISIVARRAFYYYAGDAEQLSTSHRVAETLRETASKATEALAEAATQLANTTQAAAVTATASAQMAASEVSAGL